MSPLLISLAVFCGVAALVGGLAVLMRGGAETKVENRLQMLTTAGTTTFGKDTLLKTSLLSDVFDKAPGIFEQMLARFGSITRLFEQADTNLTPARFLAISGVLGVGGAATCVAAGVNPAIAPVMALALGIMPLMWLVWRRKRRLKAFAKQLPPALELIARALRAGHSLAAGFNLVAEEMSDPIKKEFSRVFEETNLGIALEEALDSLTERVPNLDLRFFATAIVLQKQTGGDLAEILDKIGRLIRERFQIWGQIQALTGEGRLSGIVLLALPPVLFLAVYRLNPDYVMVLFTDPMGKQMLAGAIFLQILGALWIRKIINIRV